MAKYHSALAPACRELLAQGYTVHEVCSMLQIARCTFYRWLDTYPEFAGAREQGTDDFVARFHRAMRDLSLAAPERNNLHYH